MLSFLARFSFNHVLVVRSRRCQGKFIIRHQGSFYSNTMNRIKIHHRFPKYIRLLIHIKEAICLKAAAAGTKGDPCSSPRSIEYRSDVVQKRKEKEQKNEKAIRGSICHGSLHSDIRSSNLIIFPAIFRQHSHLRSVRGHSIDVASVKGVASSVKLFTDLFDHLSHSNT